MEKGVKLKGVKSSERAKIDAFHARIKQVTLLIASKLLVTEDENKLLDLQAALNLLNIAASGSQKNRNKLISEAISLIS